MIAQREPAAEPLAGQGLALPGLDRRPATGGRRLPSLGWLALAALTVAVLVAAGLGVRGGSSDGPMYFPHAGQDTIGFNDVHTGDTLTFGAVVVLNSGDSPITLRSAEFVGGDPAVASAGRVLVAGWQRRTGAVSTARQFPPPAALFGVPLQDINGATVPPAPVTADYPTELLIRVDVHRATEVTFTGVRITYEYRGDTFTYLDPLRLQLCPRAECPTPQ